MVRPCRQCLALFCARASGLATFPIPQTLRNRSTAALSNPCVCLSVRPSTRRVLDVRGRAEGPLRRQLAAAFGVALEPRCAVAVGDASFSSHAADVGRLPATKQAMAGAGKRGKENAAGGAATASSTPRGGRARLWAATGAEASPGDVRLSVLAGRDAVGAAADGGSAAKLAATEKAPRSAVAPAAGEAAAEKAPRLGRAAGKTRVKQGETRAAAGDAPPASKASGKTRAKPGESRAAAGDATPASKAPRGGGKAAGGVRRGASDDGAEARSGGSKRVSADPPVGPQHPMLLKCGTQNPTLLIRGFCVWLPNRDQSGLFCMPHRTKYILFVW
jgi:hypothetical protein